MGPILPGRRLIPRARRRGLTALSAAGAGAAAGGTCVPRFGAAPTRTTGASALVSGLSAPQFNGIGKVRRNARAGATGGSGGKGMEQYK
jgi:hypothetical protein